MSDITQAKKGDIVKFVGNPTTYFIKDHYYILKKDYDTQPWNNTEPEFGTLSWERDESGNISNYGSSKGFELVELEPIENVEVGDLVIYFLSSTRFFKKGQIFTVEKINKPSHGNFIYPLGEDGRNNSFSAFKLLKEKNIKRTFNRREYYQ